MTAPRSSPAPVHVLLISPYGAAGGGMGRCMESLAAAAPDGFTFTLIDSRGQGHALWSVLFVMRAALRITMVSLNRHHNILHVNMAERGSVLRKGLLLHIARLFGMPCVLHIHAAELTPHYHRLPPIARRLLRVVLQRADAVIVLGRDHAAWAREQAGVAADRIAIVPNGVAPPGPRSTPRTGTHLLFLGNLVARKGVTDLLRALAAPGLRDLPWSLTMAGAGDTESLRREAARLGLAARIHMPGWVGRDASRALLAQAGALILPSYYEALPLSVLEALSYGVPVITTPVGSLAAFLTDGETALLVAPGDTAALSHAILTLLTNQASAQRIGQAGQALYEAEFTLARFAERVCAVYRRITKS